MVKIILTVAVIWIILGLALFFMKLHLRRLGKEIKK